MFFLGFWQNFKLYKKRLKKGITQKKRLTLATNIIQLEGYRKHLKHITKRKSFLDAPKIINTHKSFGSNAQTSVDLEIVELENTYVFARTHSIADERLLFNYSLLHSTPQHKPKNKYIESLIYNKAKEVDVYFSQEERLDEGCVYIHLLHEHSNNYFHWITEVLPRALEVDKLLQSSDHYVKQKKVVLVDAGLHKNLYELLFRCLHFEYELLYIKEYSSCKVRRLLYCAPLWYSLDNVTKSFNVKKDFFVDRYAIEQVYDALKPLDRKNAFKKIYLQRPETHARAISNEEELIALLESKGFKTVRPDKMNLDEQISLFREARVVVGVSGAAFSNILYMQEKTQAIIFSPSVEGSNYYVFEQLASVANVNITHLLTHSPKVDSVHSEAAIDIKLLKNIIE